MQQWHSRPALGRLFPSSVDHLSRRARRLIVVLAYLALPEAVVVFCLHGGVPTGPEPSYGVSSLEFMVVAQAGLAGAVLNQGWKAAIGPRGLDERQRQLRDRAAYLSFRIVVVAVVLATLMLYATVLLFPFKSWGPITLDSTGLIALATCVLVLCFCLSVLPMAVLAWLEADEPSEV